MTTLPPTIRPTIRHGRLAACLLALLLTGCEAQSFPLPHIQGSGNVKTETRTVGDFDSIEVGSAVQLDVVVGPATSLEVTADDNILPHIKTEVSGKQLKIRMDASTSSSNVVRLKATAPALNSLVASGATTTTLSDVTADDFQLTLSGASTCTFAGKANALQVTAHGASRATLTGEAQRLTVKCAGASTVAASEMKAEAADVSADGASTANVNAAQEISARASGASTVTFSGKPTLVTTDASGASSISAE